MGKLTLQDLAKSLAGKSGLVQRDASLFASEVFAVILQGLEKDGQVKVKGLGTFKIISVEARESISVRTGERVVIQTDFLSPFFADRWFFNFSIKPQQDSEVYYEHVFNSLFFDAVLRPEEASLPVYGLIEAQGVSMSIEVLREEGAKCPG